MAVGLITAFNAAAKGLVSAVGANTLKVAAAGAIFAEVGDKLAKSLKDITKVDQRLSVINTDLRKTLDGNSKALEDTTGGLVQASKALTELRILGFKDSNKNLVNLATRLKLSGQNTEALFQVSQSLLGLGGISESAIDRFAKNVTDLSQKFGVTADSIVGAVNELTSNLTDLNILGGVESAAEFTSNLAAYVGDENAKLAGSFAKTLTSISTNQNQLAIAGLEGLANEIATGSSRGFVNQRQQIIDAGNTIRGILGQQGEVTLRQLQALRPIVGDIGVQTVRLAEELRKGAPETTFGDRIGELVEVFKERLLAPFNSAIVKLQPSFEFLIKGLSLFGTSILNFVTSFTPILAGIARLVGLVAGAIGAIVNVISFIVDSVLSVFGMSQGGYDKILGTLDGINKASMDSAVSLNEIGTIQKEDRRREAFNISSDTKDLEYISARRLNIIDSLLRSAEVEPLSQLLEKGNETNEHLRALVGYGRKGARTRIRSGSSEDKRGDN